MGREGEGGGEREGDREGWRLGIGFDALSTHPLPPPLLRGLDCCLGPHAHTHARKHTWQTHMHARKHTTSAVRVTTEQAYTRTRRPTRARRERERERERAREGGRKGERKEVGEIHVDPHTHGINLGGEARTRRPTHT